MVTEPVPVGDKLIVWLFVIAETLPSIAWVAPAVPTVNVPAGEIVTVPVPVGDRLMVWLFVVATMLPCFVVVTPAVPTVKPPAGDMVTVPEPVGDRVTFLLEAVIETVFARVIPAAATVRYVLPSAAKVTDPVPASVTVTLESPCAIELDDNADTDESTYDLVATSPALVGADVDNPVILLVVASITISPTDNPLLTLKFLVVMVPCLPHDC
jgi:hypothetical protein